MGGRKTGDDGHTGATQNHKTRHSANGAAATLLLARPSPPIGHFVHSSPHGNLHACLCTEGSNEWNTCHLECWLEYRKWREHLGFADPLPDAGGGDGVAAVCDAPLGAVACCAGGRASGFYV